VFEIILGCVFVLVALHPGSKFHPGRLGTRQKLAPIEPTWIGRLIFFMLGIGVILDALRELHKHN
jgi:hypothetical protein